MAEQPPTNAQAPRPSNTGPQVSPKGIVVVHGMGSQPKGDTIYRFINPLVAYVTEILGKAPSITPSVPDAESDEPAVVEVEYPGEQKWIFVEAWWAQSFPTAKFDPVLGWAESRMLQHVLLLLGAMIRYVVLALGSIGLYSQLLLNSAINEARHRSPVLQRPQSEYLRLCGSFAQQYALRLSVLNGWLGKLPLVTDDREILEEMKSPSFYQNKERYLRLVFLWVNVFHLFNSLAMVLLSILGLLASVPAMTLLTALNLVGGLARIPTLVSNIKGALDPFLVGSLGDIQVFLERPVEAAQMRGEVEKALRLSQKHKCSDIYLIAHSTGVPICYETLVDEDNRELSQPVARLYTFGSIMRLAWQTPQRRRPNLRAPLSAVNNRLQWHNFWARYDPAFPGPVSQEYAAVTRDPEQRRSIVVDIPVTNENSLLFDHVTYEANREQVISRLAADLWGDTFSPVSQTTEQVRANTISRIERVLKLAFPRLLVIYMVPGLLALFSANISLAARWSHWVVQLIGPEGWADRHLLHPVTDKVGLDTWWEAAVAVLLATGLIVIATYVLYVAYKNLYWERRVPPVRVGPNTATPTP